jgi:NAD(P)-dependent dehydrogenase (short-subunit alcohol dehydrogenase family)
MNVKDKIAVVTGGSKGYGAGIAEVLQREGARVWITGRDAPALKAAAQRLGVRAVRADVTRPRDWDRVFDTVLKAAGRLDILVNNAGGGVKIAPMSEQTDESIAQIVALNLTGQLYGCRRAAKVMAAQRDGVIVNISSGKVTMQPLEMGQLVLDICRTPAHLAIPDVTVQPLVQQIEPM